MVGKQQRQMCIQTDVVILPLGQSQSSFRMRMEINWNKKKVWEENWNPNVAFSFKLICTHVTQLDV